MGGGAGEDATYLGEDDHGPRDEVQRNVNAGCWAVTLLAHLCMRMLLGGDKVRLCNEEELVPCLGGQGRVAGHEGHVDEFLEGEAHIGYLWERALREAEELGCEGTTAKMEVDANRLESYLPVGIPMEVRS